MEKDMHQLINGFAGRRILVLGDLIIDGYLRGSCTRLSPEAPVPVVRVGERQYFAGGAANVAANLAAMGAVVRFCTVTGDDGDADRAERLLEARSVDPGGLIRDPERRTIVKERVVAGTQMLARVDRGTETPVGRATEDRLIGLLEKAYADCEALVIADYAKGIMTGRMLQSLKALRRERPAFLAVDSKQLTRFRPLQPSLAKPNAEEAFALLHAALPSANRLQALRAQAARISRATGAALTAITMDADGAVGIPRGAPPCHVPAWPVAHPQVAGAGDTFISALTLALLSGASLSQALNLAGAAASIAVAKPETACCAVDELRAVYALPRKPVAGMQELAALVHEYRRQGKRIVFTNGCFDILHSGHVSLLRRAARLGDVMIVGLNTDDSIRRLKGPERPINPLKDRVEVLSGLTAVDHIITFGEAGNDQPLQLIETIRPDVFVKGGDYADKTLPEASCVEGYGGVVRYLSLLPDHSTTGVIGRIRRARSIRIS